MNLAAALRNHRRKIVGLIRARGRGMSVAIFIDTNQYLDLYRMVPGKELLEAIEEQRKYIFVSTQIVDEVMRRKLDCAAKYFADQMKEIDASNTVVPDHLLDISDDKVEEYRTIFNKAKVAKEEIRKYFAKTLLRISQSADDVSKRLGVLFDAAVEPSPEEIERARERREKGNPPGKARDTLGDQIAWEQFLAHCKKTGVKRVWIVSRDSDYLTKVYGEVLIDPFLHRELRKACGDDVEVRPFDNAMTAIKDFVKNANVPAEKLPTEERAKEIEEEQQALPPFGWSTYDDGGILAARRRAMLNTRFKALDDGEHGQYCFVSQPSLALRMASLKNSPDKGT